jgi:Uma2 family endonuclease
MEPVHPAIDPPRSEAMPAAEAAVCLPPGPPNPPPSFDLYRLRVEQYEQMGNAGILSEDDRVELIAGYLVQKMIKNEPHSAACTLTRDAISGLIPGEWYLRVECPLRILSFDEPEPDFAIVQGSPRDHFRLKRAPEPPEVALVIEVAETSLQRDRTEKLRAYAHGGIPTYWIVNLIDRQVEVHTNPENDRYAEVHTFKPGQAIGVVIDGREVGRVEVADLLP